MEVPIASIRLKLFDFQSSCDFTLIGYSLGRFYGDDAIKKRIERHIAYEKSLEEKKARQKEAARLSREAMTPAEKKLDKSAVKIKKIREQDASSITKENIGLARWTNRQNAMRMQQISAELKEKFGISYTDIKGHISSLRAQNNRLLSDITKEKKMQKNSDSLSNAA